MNCDSLQEIAVASLKRIFHSFPVVLAITFPELGPFISLVGALCLSTLGLMFPAIIELVIYWEEPGMGAYNWRLYKNLAIIAFGLLGLVTGTYTSLWEMGMGNAH